MTEERRLVTILFADVVGSTALGEALDPEDVRALLARLFAIATEAVERHGGRVDVTSVEGGSTTFSVRLPLGTRSADR